MKYRTIDRTWCVRICRVHIFKCIYIKYIYNAKSRCIHQDVHIQKARVWLGWLDWFQHARWAKFSTSRSWFLASLSRFDWDIHFLGGLGLSTSKMLLQLKPCFDFEMQWFLQTSLSSHQKTTPKENPPKPEKGQNAASKYENSHRSEEVHPTSSNNGHNGHQCRVGSHERQSTMSTAVQKKSQIAMMVMFSCGMPEPPHHATKRLGTWQHKES